MFLPYQHHLLLPQLKSNATVMNQLFFVQPSKERTVVGNSTAVGNLEKVNAVSLPGLMILNCSLINLLLLQCHFHPFYEQILLQIALIPIINVLVMFVGSLVILPIIVLKTRKNCIIERI